MDLMQFSQLHSKDSAFLQMSPVYMNTNGVSSHECTTVHKHKAGVDMVKFSGLVLRFYAPDNPVAYYSRRTVLPYRI